MKTKMINCECDFDCVGKLTLVKPKKNHKATFYINNDLVDFGLYKLYRIKNWISSAIGEIEEQTKLDKQKRSLKN